MSGKDFKITFWGVRGSRPVPGKDTVYYGGNTPCVTLEAGNSLIIFDSGTGICNLGNKLIEENREQIRAHIFITHTHWDHIQGFPFFTPAFLPGNEFYLYGQSKMNLNIANMMKGQMVFPHFPVQLEQMKSKIHFNEVDSEMEIEIEEGVSVRIMHNNHPGDSLSYRVDYKGRSCSYITDTEHYACLDPYLKSLVEGTDYFIYDTNFTDEEYEGNGRFSSKVGWGHSTWQEGVKMAQAAQVNTLVLFHHATCRTDKDMREIELEAQGRFKNSIAAAEGMSLD